MSTSVRVFGNRSDLIGAFADVICVCASISTGTLSTGSCFTFPRGASAKGRTVWWQARCSLVKRRQQLLSETEALLRDLPLELIEQLPDAKEVRPRLAALEGATRECRRNRVSVAERTGHDCIFCFYFT